MGPHQPTMVVGRAVRRVLAGGEVLGGEEQALHNLQDLLITMVGDVHKKQWWSMAGGKGWRRAHVPGEGPANTNGGGAHEHRGSVGVRFQYPIWPEVGRKGVVDGEVDLELLRRVAARDRVDSGQGKSEARPERVGRLAGEERKLLGAGIWTGWSGRGEFRRALGGRLSGREEEKRVYSRKERARVGLYRGASLCRKGEGEQTRGQAQVDRRRRCAPRACVAAARHRRLDVAGRGGASRGGAGGGRSSQARRRTRESDAGATEPQENGWQGRRGRRREETEEPELEEENED
jgi:hypothetical protein